MTAVSVHQVRSAAYRLTVTLLLAPGLALAQGPSDSTPPVEAPQQQQAPASPGGWRRFSDPPRSQPAVSPTPGNPSSQPQDPSAAQSQAPDQNSNYTVPSRLTLKSGTFVTVRVNQFLSSDRNRAGDAFSATLEQPLVIDGVVVAQRGETVAGRVAEAQKAGRVKGVSRLGLRLTEVTLVDGQQLPIESRLLGWTGPRSEGRDVAGVGTSTALGAAVGAAADWGRGAAIGAGAGAVAGVVGVLLTRGRPTIIYPESVLTFQIEAPATILTDRSPQAFRYVESNDYDRPYQTPGPPPARPACAGYGCSPPPPPPYYYGDCWPGYCYPYYGYYPYYGSAFFFGPRFFYGRGFHGHGFRR